MQSLRSLRALRPHTATKKTFQQIRHFHPTRPSPFVNELLQVSSGFIHGIHAVTGLPWVFTIPLTALIIRSVVAMPLQIYTKMQARKELDLSPLALSWSKKYAREVKGLVRSSSVKGPLLPAEAKVKVAKMTRQRRKMLNKRWNIKPYWRFVPLVQIPIWLSVMESIRSMSGVQQGLLSFFQGLFREAPAVDASNTPNLLFEPSLATEGALWFPDLLAGDPTGALPCLLTLTIFLNVRSGFKGMAPASMADLPSMQLVWQSILQVLRGTLYCLAVHVGLSAFVLELPSALMIYWITSTNVATLQTFLLDKYLFAKPPLKAWKQVFIGYDPRQSPKN